MSRRLVIRLKHRRYKPRYVKKPTSKKKKKKSKRRRNLYAKIRNRKKNKKKLAFSKQIPAKSKFPRLFKGKNRSNLNYCKNVSLLNFGLSGIQILKSTRLSAKNLYESIQLLRRSIFKKKKIKGRRKKKGVRW